jgi:hypothetical protein
VIPADHQDLSGGEHDPADSWGVSNSEPLPSLENSPHWQEIQT